MLRELGWMYLFNLVFSDTNIRDSSFFILQYNLLLHICLRPLIGTREVSESTLTVEEALNEVLEEKCGYNMSAHRIRIKQ